MIDANNRYEHDGCFDCRYVDYMEYQFPCIVCRLNKSCDDPGFDTAPDLYEPRVDDAVSHPSHYTSGKIEVWDFIADQGLNYDRGCAIKYVCRAGKKDPAMEAQDLKKAIAYLEHQLTLLKCKVDGIRMSMNLEKTDV